MTRRCDNCRWAWDIIPLDAMLAEQGCYQSRNREHYEETGHACADWQHRRFYVRLWSIIGGAAGKRTNTGKTDEPGARL